MTARHSRVPRACSPRSAEDSTTPPPASPRGAGRSNAASRTAARPIPSQPRGSAAEPREEVGDREPPRRRAERHAQNLDGEHDRAANEIRRMRPSARAHVVDHAATINASAISAGSSTPSTVRAGRGRAEGLDRSPHSVRRTPAQSPGRASRRSRAASAACGSRAVTRKGCAAKTNPPNSAIIEIDAMWNARAASPYPAANLVANTSFATANPTNTMAVASETPSRPHAR